MKTRKRMLKRHGQMIVMRKYSWGPENEYDDRERVLDVEKEIVARADIGRQGDIERGPNGESHVVDADLYISSEHDAEDIPPVTEFDVNRHTYKTVIVDRQDTGIDRVRCRRK